MFPLQTICNIQCFKEYNQVLVKGSIIVQRLTKWEGVKLGYTSILSQCVGRSKDLTGVSISSTGWITSYPPCG